jgi:hypothetical protein
VHKVEKQHANAGGLLDVIATSNFLSIGWILTLSTALRVSSIFVLRSFLHPGTWEFAEIARSVVAGHGYIYSGSPSAYMPPGYPLLLAGIFAVFGEGAASYLFLELVQAALGALLVYLVYRLALTIYSDQVTARLAALLAGLYPPFIQMCNEFHSINFYIVLGVAAVLFLVRAIQQPSRRDYVVYCAVCLGVLQMFRAETLALTLLFAMLLFWQRQRAFLVRPLLLWAISYSFAGPWTLRNYRLFHELIPATTSFGSNLWIGHNPKATGSDRAEIHNHVNFYTVPPAAMQAELDAVPPVQDKEVRVGRIFEREALSYLVSHPGSEIILAIKKLCMFWSFDPNHEKGRRPAYWVPSVVLSILAVTGLFVGDKRPPMRELSPVLISILYNLFMGLVFFVLPRYKIAIDPLLCVLAANTGTYLILRRGPTLVASGHR